MLGIDSSNQLENVEGIPALEIICVFSSKLFHQLKQSQEPLLFLFSVYTTDRGDLLRIGGELEGAIRFRPNKEPLSVKSLYCRQSQNTLGTTSQLTTACEVNNGAREALLLLLCPWVGSGHKCNATI